MSYENEPVSNPAPSINELKTNVMESMTYIKSKYDTLSEKVAYVEEQVMKDESRRHRAQFLPGPDAYKQSSDPDLAEFLQKGIMPPTSSKSLSVTNDGQGVSVRSEWSDRIYKLIRETSPVCSVASVVQTDSNELEVLVDRDEPLSDWISELDPRADTDTSFVERLKIPVYEHYARPEATQQILEDSQFDVESWLAGKIQSRFGRQENTAFMLGDGSGRPRGILNYGTVPEASFVWGADPSAYALGAHYTGIAGDVSDPDCLFDLVDSLKAPYLASSVWMMTRAFRNKVRKLKDNEDRYLFEPSLQAGTPDRLLGYPVVLSEDMPDVAANAPVAIFGDFGQGYTIADRVGLQVVRDNLTKPGWIRWYARKRVGGKVTNPEALKVLIAGIEPQ